VVFRDICGNLSELSVVASIREELAELSEAEREQALTRYRILEPHLTWSGASLNPNRLHSILEHELKRQAGDLGALVGKHQRSVSIS
jgi:hypothetical protein